MTPGRVLWEAWRVAQAAPPDGRRLPRQVVFALVTALPAWDELGGEDHARWEQAAEALLLWHSQRDLRADGQLLDRACLNHLSTIRWATTQHQEAAMGHIGNPIGRMHLERLPDERDLQHEPSAIELTSPEVPEIDPRVRQIHDDLVQEFGPSAPVSA